MNIKEVARRAVLRSLLSAALFVLGVVRLPYLWCSRDADEWYKSERSRIESLARGAGQCLDGALSRKNFVTGSSQFNGEWLFGTYLMAGLGFGQCALHRPELRGPYLKSMSRCIELLLSPEVRAFDRETWGNDPLETLDSASDHAAYLGYLNLLLSLHRRLEPHSEYAELNDRITAALVRRMEASPTRLIQSYPFEVYPVDNCAAFGSIGLHALATERGLRISAEESTKARVVGESATRSPRLQQGGSGLRSSDRSWSRDALVADGRDEGPAEVQSAAPETNHADFMKAWSQNLRRRYIDKETGLLYQAVDHRSGSPYDAPRGSGTTLAVYFVSFADVQLSGELYQAAHTHLFRTVLGFGGMREYPVTVKGGGGDIDSGPVVFGLGLSPTGFMIAGSRIHGDQNAFRRFFATAYAWGAPLERDQELHFVTGGPLGDSILFAMLTACNPRTLRDPATPVPQGSLEGIGGRAFTSQEGRAPSRPDK